MSSHRAVAESSDGSHLGSLARFVLRHRRSVMIFWLAIFIAGAGAAGRVSSRLTFDFSLPGQPGYETGVKVLHLYGNGGGNLPSILVVTVPKGQSVAEDTPKLARAFSSVTSVTSGNRIIDYLSTGDHRFITDAGRSTFVFVYTPPLKSLAPDQHALEMVTGLQAALPGYSVGVTGLGQLASGGSSRGPGVLIETMFGGIGALAVLAFVFASFLALVPILIAAVSILATFLVILGLTYFTPVSFIVQYLVALVGLGVGIDYSLLLVTRWREERARGVDNETAVRVAVVNAGHAVVLSGFTVAIGLLALVVIPVPSLRSTGLGGMLIPLISILVVLTLLPAILGGAGPRVDWPRIRHERDASRAWSSWARGVTKNRWLATCVSGVILLLCVAPVFNLKVGQTSADAYSKVGNAHLEYQELISHGVPSGILTPIEVLAKQSVAPALVSVLGRVPGIAFATYARDQGSIRHGYVDILAVPSVETVNNLTLAPVKAVQHVVAHRLGVFGVTGIGAIQQDYSHAVFGNFPLMFTLIAVLTFVLLSRAFRSIVLAAKAVILNLISLAATFGVLTWFWQEGHGSSVIFNIPATGAITFWMPLMIFAFLFGLSMDYEVFILSRIREEFDRTNDTTTAVIEGLGRTGRLVTSAALILFLAFASLASAPDTDIKVLATGLGAGILLDATVIRALLVPALVALFGRWNWWYPRAFARPLLSKARELD
ncbi:MAG TPA: MMPL family transporter [Acidimicrobiales bacterium]|nr:MMPL family transporter [Acidimicrobiales bacterium]